jgi:spore maturation protein CgeB
MHIVMFVHSLRSCWGNSQAHFLRGVASELLARGHTVNVYEPRNGWSAKNLVDERGPAALLAYRATYPGLDSTLYQADELDLDRALDGADLVLVHGWTPPELVARIGQARRSNDFVLLFHDTHHRAVTEPNAMGALDLKHYDGVLAFGEVLRDLYVRRSWAQRAWTWHEAADTRVFRPQAPDRRDGELVWLGEWGDRERNAELDAYLFAPALEAKLTGTGYGARYPLEGRETVRAAGLRYGGWLANHQLPQVYARFKLTVHVPRRLYQALLPGIPTMRMFEAFACGIPLISAPWRDVENLFEPGVHYFSAQTTHEMANCMRVLVHDEDAARELAGNARKRILERHTCAHRVDALLDIAAGVKGREKVHRMD